MDEAEFLASTDPAAMLEAVRWDERRTPPHRGATDRKLRLFACACARRWHDLTATEEAEVARVEALEGPQSAADYQAINPLLIGSPAGWAMHWAQRDEAPAEKAALLRCLFGNPFRPASLGLALALDRPLVCGLGLYTSVSPRQMARAIYDGRDWAALPVLADALEEAGCTDAALLAHLRETVPCANCGGQVRYQPSEAGCLECHSTGRLPAPHARGCWVLDALLGKE